jgi:hypothetical protein
MTPTQSELCSSALRRTQPEMGNDADLRRWMYGAHWVHTFYEAGSARVARPVNTNGTEVCAGTQHHY